MDSGNSGSLQSSSGGDDDYDSRATAPTTAAFIDSHQTLPNPPPSFLHYRHDNNPPSIFDPLSNYFDTRPSSNTNSLLNLDPLIWSKPDQINPFLSPQHESSSSFPTPPPPSLPPVVIDQNPRPTGARNPKKRTRASRRAPTTVLTTDTTNFRAMVQEFTGIPSPPFSSSSQFPRSRIDLFGTSSSIRSNPNTFENTPPPYLLRPFPQKLQPPPFHTSTPQQMAGSSSSNLQNSVQTSFLSQTTPSLSFLAGLTKTQNSGNILPASSSDHQPGQVSGPMQDGSNYNSYSAGSIQAPDTMMNVSVNTTRGEGTVDSWICSTSD